MREHDGKRRVTSPVSRLRVRVDLDETGDGVARLRREREKDLGSCARTHEISVAARESRVLAGTDTAGGFRWMIPRNGNDIISWDRGPLISHAYVRACGRRNHNLNRNGQQVLSRARDSITSSRYTSARARPPYMRGPYGKNRPVTSLISFF